jgi:hypothetical protein
MLLFKCLISPQTTVLKTALKAVLTATLLSLYCAAVSAQTAAPTSGRCIFDGGSKRLYGNTAQMVASQLDYEYDTNQKPSGAHNSLKVVHTVAGRSSTQSVLGFDIYDVRIQIKSCSFFKNKQIKDYCMEDERTISAVLCGP